MSRYTLSPRAQRDVSDIWDYSAARWSTARADRYIRELVEGIEYVAADPRRGRSCHDVRPGYRKHVIGSHVVFYRVLDDVVDVVRILHARMDFKRHL